MKRCPKCHRAYEDETLRFCLEDGSPLFDARDSDAPATEILPARGTPTLRSTGPTVPSYQAVGGPSPEIREPRTSNPILTVGVVAIVLLLLALVAIAGFFVFRQSREKEPEVTRTATPTTSPTAVTRAGDGDSNATVNSSPVYGTPLKITASASSIRLAVQANTYYASNAIDGKRATAWIEGADGPGIGEWIRFDFDREITLHRILWQPGYFKSPAIWNQNNRLATVRAEFSNGTSRELTSANAPVGADQQPNAQDQDDVVRVSTDLVVLNVTVLDKNGKFVTGLKSGDFQISEDGVEQKVAAFSAEETPFAAAILLDTSGSMESRLTLGRSAAIRFLDGLREQDVASIYSFDSKVEQWNDFSPGRDLPPRVYGLKTKTMTALNDAVVRAAEDLAKREEKRRAIVVLSDGGENYSRASSDQALDRASLAAATIYGVNMSEQGPKRDLAAAGTLRNLAEKSGGRYIDTPGGLQLRDSFASIAEELGHQYTISYRPSNRARDGKWRKIDVKLAKPDVNVRTRKGYRAPKG